MFRTFIAAALVAAAAAVGAASVANAEAYYKNCDAARDARRDADPAGRGRRTAEHLDRDSDGIACES